MCTALCKTERVSLSGCTIVLRIPKMSDVRTMLSFINSLVDEDAQILVNTKFTLKAETKYLKGMLQRVRKGKVHIISAFYNGECIGSVTVEKGMYRESHVANLAISVKRDFRNMGLGSLLLGRMIEVAKQDPETQILNLKVYQSNIGAQKLYKKFGFKITAELPRRIAYKGKYENVYVMDFPLNKD